MNNCQRNHQTLVKKGHLDGIDYQNDKNDKIINNHKGLQNEKGKEIQRTFVKIEKVFQPSTYQKDLGDQICGCGKNRSSASSIKKIKDLKYEILLLKKELQSTQDQVHLLLANFNFIIELTAENLNRETAQRIEKILREKNQIIQKQKQKISLLEQSQFYIKNQEEDSNHTIKDQLAQAEQKIKELEAENKTLKEMNYSVKAISAPTVCENISSNFEDASVAHKKTTDSSNNGIFTIAEEQQEGSTHKSQLMESRSYKVKKRNTLGNGNNEVIIHPCSPSETENKIKSLGNLKMKIHRLKAELQHGYQANH